MAAFLLATAGLASTTTPASAGDDAKGPRTDSVAPKGFPTNDPPPAGFSSWKAVLKAQAQLDKAAGAVIAANGKGFAGVEVSPETGTLKVFYKGSLDTATSAAIGKAKSSVKVVVTRATYSQAELIAAASQLAKTKGVTSVSPIHDGSGLDVGLADVRPVARTALRSSVRLVVSDVPVRPFATSRGDDSTPYWGGARWNGCSTGFAVNHVGYTRMLSAGHCGSNGQSAYDGGGQYMGGIYSDNNYRDTLLVNTRSAGRIYDGGVGVGEFSKPVIGWQYNYVGDYLCQSGAYSGATCNIKVTAVNQFVTLSGTTMYPLVRVEQVSRRAWAGQGDSGGPVFNLAWWDYGKTYARGTVSGGDGSTATACQGVQGRLCSWRGWFAPIDVALNERGATIVTG